MIDETTSTNGATRKIPSGLVSFEFPDGKVVSLKVRQAMREFGAVADQLNRAAEAEGRQATHDEYLEALVPVVGALAGVQIDVDEADQLNDYLAVAAVELKKKASAALRSASSMD